MSNQLSEPRKKEEYFITNMAGNYLETKRISDHNSNSSLHKDIMAPSAIKAGNTTQSTMILTILKKTHIQIIMKLKWKTIDKELIWWINIRHMQIYQRSTSITITWQIKYNRRRRQDLWANQGQSGNIRVFTICHNINNQYRKTIISNSTL